MDNKSKKGVDANLIAFKQKYEFDYARNQLQKQVPGSTKTDASQALTQAAREVSPSEGRAKVMRAALRILKS